MNIKQTWRKIVCFLFAHKFREPCHSHIRIIDNNDITVAVYRCHRCGVLMDSIDIMLERRGR